ncbi:hypothetical protein HG536_0F01460 [Torulaspora globosa]|uniref:Uncharacterized protein n=1 Tax=Torulaspora globosa TaxID=48254 RepID=A0A7G3ZJY5_9SACH|nr:uncharacterized protein HG536_0F01460 [Torulaspora globosa]QLL33821.1 hypothetical protein HG536_0F01460 [Torulaspora globosa]
MSSNEQLSQLGRALSTTAAALFGSQNMEDTILSYSSPYKRALHQAMTNIGSDGAAISLGWKGKNGPGTFQSLYSSQDGKSFFRNKITDSKTSFKVLSYLSDDLLHDIPGDEAETKADPHSRLLLKENGEAKGKKKSTTQDPSLFQGFEASLPIINEALKHQSSSSGSEIKTIRGPELNDTEFNDNNGIGEQFILPDGLKPERITESYSRRYLKAVSSQVTDSLDLLEIQKKVAASEIREIDGKLERLRKIRESVFKRIARIEQNELFLENNLDLVRDRLSFLEEYGLEMENGTENDDKGEISPEVSEQTDFKDSDMGNARSEEDISDKSIVVEESSNTSALMSRSIYMKLKTKDESPVKKLRNFYHDNNKKRRKTFPTLQQYYSRGSKINAFKGAHNESITCLDFDVPFGTLCTAGHLDHSIKIWDLSQKKQIGQMSGHKASISCMQMDNRYSMLITGGRDAVLKMWDLNLGAQLYQEQSDVIPSTESACVYTFDSHVDEITALSFDSAYLVSGSQDRTVRQWDLSSGKCLQTIDLSFAGRLSQNNSASSSSMLTPTDISPIIGALQCFDAALATGTKDGMVRLWDLRSGKVIRTLEGHTDAITALKFDSRNLITGSLDRSVRIWDLRTGTLADAFAYESPVLSLDFDSQSIVVANREATVQVVDRNDDKHWQCGAQDSSDSSTAQFVRYKDGYMVEGRSNGDVAAWAL